MPTDDQFPDDFSIPDNAPADLVVEDDDFLEHWDFDADDMETDEQAQELRALFPDGDASLEQEWREVFEIQRSLITIAPLTAVAYGVVSGYSGSGYDIGIADRLRAYGLKVVEIAGWKTRGSSTFHPRGSVDHHTAGGFYGNAPSLNICINGRSDLPGPLCHVLIGRDNTCYVIAAGRANHAGTGSYAGVAGNSNVYGVEHENTGTGSEPWREDQRHTAARVHAALLNWKRNGFVCQHKEWTSRKIDKWGQTGPDMRTRVVAAWAAFDKPVPPPSNKPKDEDVIAEIIKTYYRMARGKTYDVSVEDLNGYLHWLGNCARSSNPVDLVNDYLRPQLQGEVGREFPQV